MTPAERQTAWLSMALLSACAFGMLFGAVFIEPTHAAKFALMVFAALTSGLRYWLRLPSNTTPPQIPPS
jgi:hypothetical protein